MAVTSTGKVDHVASEFKFEWKVDNFFSLPIEDEEVCISPYFSFAGESCYLALYPNGQTQKNSVGYIGLYLHRHESGSTICLAVTLGLKTFDGKKGENIQFTKAFEKGEGYGCPNLIKRSTLSEKKLELVPSDTLTVFCTVDHYSTSTGNNEMIKCSHCKKSFGAVYVSYHEQKCLDKPIKRPTCEDVVDLRNWFNHECEKAKVKGIDETDRCPHCKESLDAKCVSSHEKKCRDKPIRCPTCTDVVALRKWLDHKCDKARVKTFEKLVDDLRNIFASKEHSDVTIKVKDEEFRLHRNILAGRNPYFNSMFKTEMKEKATGIVSIEDCDPDVFRSFLLFIYTGKVDKMSLENVCVLYELADKYQEDQLKEECLCFMKANISIESFCDFIVMALKHDETELLQNATELFCRNTKEIIASVKWQIFLKEHSTQANELYLKSFNFNVK